MDAEARHISPGRTALVGLAGLASAMGVGRFAFTPLLPLMQGAGALTLAQGGTLAAANYVGYLAGALACMFLRAAPRRVAGVGLVAVAALTAGMGATDAFAAWLALRFLAGVASALVLVGASAWALPLLASRGRASWSGWVYAGVGVGIFLAGVIALATAVLGRPPGQAWIALGACAAAVALATGTPMAAATLARPRGGAGRPALGAEGWRDVLCYGAFGFGYIVPATFLPAAARQLAADPAAFGWTWPVFGLAAAASTVAASRWRGIAPRTLWAGAQAVMAAGVLAPAIRMSLATLLVAAVCVGGTFMVVTMAGMEEARRIGGASAPRLMATMTAAFAVGQLAGPFTVTLAGPARAASMGPAHAAAAAVLLLGVCGLMLGGAGRRPFGSVSTEKGAGT